MWTKIKIERSCTDRWPIRECAWRPQRAGLLLAITGWCDAPAGDRQQSNAIGCPLGSACKLSTKNVQLGAYTPPSHLGQRACNGTLTVGDIFLVWELESCWIFDNSSYFAWGDFDWKLRCYFPPTSHQKLAFSGGNGESNDKLFRDWNGG